MLCYKCQKTNHEATECKQKFFPCKICSSRSHHPVNCHKIKMCVKNKTCRKKHHFILDCSIEPCTICSLMTHKTEQCAEKPCLICNKFNHSTAECFKNNNVS